MRPRRRLYCPAADRGDPRRKRGASGTGSVEFGRSGLGQAVRITAIGLVIGVVGAAMLLMGRMFRRAGAMQDELERFV